MTARPEWVRAAALAIVTILASAALAPASPARADDETAFLLIGGELALLGGSVATTLGVASCMGEHQHPPAALLVPHFLLAAGNLVVGTLLTLLAFSGESQDSLGRLLRTVLGTFGLLQLVDGALMALLGVLSLTLDEEDGTPATAMLAPLTVALP